MADDITRFLADARTLTADQVAWHEAWPGQVDVAEDFETAWAIVQREAQKAGRI